MLTRNRKSNIKNVGQGEDIHLSKKDAEAQKKMSSSKSKNERVTRKRSQKGSGLNEDFVPLMRDRSLQNSKDDKSEFFKTKQNLVKVSKILSISDIESNDNPRKVKTSENSSNSDVNHKTSKTLRRVTRSSKYVNNTNSSCKDKTVNNINFKNSKLNISLQSHKTNNNPKIQNKEQVKLTIKSQKLNILKSELKLSNPPKITRNTRSCTSNKKLNKTSNIMNKKGRLNVSNSEISKNNKPEIQIEVASKSQVKSIPKSQNVKIVKSDLRLSNSSEITRNTRSCTSNKKLNKTSNIMNKKKRISISKSKVSKNISANKTTNKDEYNSLSIEKGNNSQLGKCSSSGFTTGTLKYANNTELSFNRSTEKDKVPIWKKMNLAESPLFNFKSHRRSTRVSTLKNKDVYEFSFEGNKENIKKKKRRKNQGNYKKKLKCSSKSSLLTTDPMFESLTKSLYNSTKYKLKQGNKGKSNMIDNNKNIPKTNTASKLEIRNNKSISDTKNENKSLSTEEIEDCLFDHTYDDIAVDDAGYEAGISLGNETANTFHSVNPSHFSVPTPNLSSLFPGVASTPRSDFVDLFNPFEKENESEQVNVEKDVKLCFGFDEPEDNIGLSPVKKSKQLALLHAVSMLSHSNIEEIEPMPTRFYIPGFKKPVLPKNQKALKSRAINNIPLRENHLNIHKKKHLQNENMGKRKFRQKENIFKENEGTVKDADKSVFFDILNDEDFSQNLAPTESNNYSLPTEAKTNMTGNSPPCDIPSLEESFTRPPKRSYNRQSLKVLRKKYEHCYRDYSTTESDTEAEECCAENKFVTTRRKRVALKPHLEENIPQKTCVKKVYLKKKGKRKENKTPPSHDEDGNNKGTTKKITNLDKTISDWASDINSHFSEIEDVPLVIG